MNESNYAAALVLMAVVFSVMVLRALHNAGARMLVLIAISVVFAIWLTGVFVALRVGFFGAAESPQLAFGMGVSIPTVVGYLAVRAWAPLRQATQAMPTSSFLLLQHMRAAFGLMFFFTAALPVWFQYIAGFGDIAAGIGAFIALRVFRGRTDEPEPVRERRAIIRGNLVGMLDFAVVLTLGVFVVLVDQSPDTMFSLIPLYAVPIFILLHIVSLQRLARLTQRPMVTSQRSRGTQC